MRNLLGIFLALHGAVWWFVALLVSFVAGMLAGSAGSLHAWPVLWKLAALPALTLILALGDAMVVFGLTLIGGDKPHLIGGQHPVIPETHAVPWFLLRSLRHAAGVLALTYTAGLFSLTFLTLADHSPDSPGLWVTTSLFTAAYFACSFLAHRSLSRFQTADSV